jgi:hypothetical protein
MAEKADGQAAKAAASAKGEAAAGPDADRGGQPARRWRPGGYGGPIPVRPEEPVGDLAGKAPGGGAPAGNAAGDRKP